MKVKGVTIQELRAIVARVGFYCYCENLEFNREPEKQGNFIFFTLRTKESAKPGHRRSHSGRLGYTACWHVYRDVFEEILHMHTEAIIVTCHARYEGVDDFLIKFPATGLVNVGSMAYPLLFQDACDCGEMITFLEVTT